MESIILRALSLTLIIIIGIIMRSTGFFSDEAGSIVKKIVMTITLPAAIITNFSRIERISSNMLFLIIMGIAANLVMLGAGVWLTQNKNRAEKAIYMNCLPAYNIGAFCLPFVQTFLPAAGSVTACLFDAGNSIMCTGGTYAISAEYLSENKKGIDVKNIAKRLFSSVPLVTYICMLGLSLLNIKVPKSALDFISPAAAANTFLCMLMIGLFFRMELKRSYLLSIFKLLAVRQLFAIFVSLFYYFILPFDLIIRQTLVLVSFGPMSIIAPVFTDACGGDIGKASAANSITIILSIIEITSLLLIMGIY
ncbi:MAG: hypothetical protein Q4F21_05360 [Lachnospiraceae bacterium]|nr:hypothetical protein [Lachnospiraceae bacterium]